MSSSKNEKNNSFAVQTNPDRKAINLPCFLAFQKNLCSITIKDFQLNESFDFDSKFARSLKWREDPKTHQPILSIIEKQGNGSLVRTIRKKQCEWIMDPQSILISKRGNIILNPKGTLAAVDDGINIHLWSVKESKC